MNTTIKTLAMAALAAFTFGFARGANAAPAENVQYFAQCALVWSSTSDEKAEKILRDNGWTPVGADFNAGASGYWVRMGVKYTTDPALAITAFAVYNGKDAPNTFERDGITFYKIGSGCVDWCPHTLDGPVDLNEHAGGDYLYIYATRDPKAGPRITAFYQSQNENQEPAKKDITDRGYEPVYDQNGNWADCNSGTGDDFLFEGYKGETVYRYPVYNVPGDPTSGVREWKEGSTNATTVAGSTSEGAWSAGWYAVRSDITFSEGVVCKGDVHLILCDGAELTVTNRTYKPGINVAGEGNALTIYGQSQGTGQLTATGRQGAGIGGGGDASVFDITINGGIVTARSRQSGSGIGGGRGGFASRITINGGEVTATGSTDNVPGIGGGNGGSATNIYVSSSQYVLADGSNPPTTSIPHSSTEDLAEKLTEKGVQGRQQYVRIGPAVTPISTQPIPVEHTTYSIYTNGVLSADGTALSNDYATVVYTADEGYAFERGPLSATNVLDTTTDPAVNAGGVAPAAPIPYIDCLAPVYRTPGDPTSGIDHWVTNTVRAYAIVRSTMTTWGEEGATNWYLVTEDTTIADRITCAGDVRLILKDGTTLNAEAGITASANTAGYLGFAVYAQSMDESTRGKLVATGAVPQYSAGIGGGNDGAGNNITINGGTVTATGGKSGAGIGGGSGGAGNNITINGAKVTATSGGNAAGIGGGIIGGGNNITINGGIVTATATVEKGWYGAGIGGGAGGAGNNIKVNGGTVTATGGEAGAGIGGGTQGAGNNITINGGTVTAAGGAEAAGIGGGIYNAGSGITISGGNVRAMGGYRSAGIGGGGGDAPGAGNNITISGGNVTATGGYYGAGIGGGGSDHSGGAGNNITISGGNVTATGGESSSAIGGGHKGSATNIRINRSVLCVKADGNNPPVTPIANDGGDLASKLAGRRYATVRPGGSIDAAAEHGTAAVVPAANSNETVTVTAKPASDYCLSAISVFKTGEETQEIPLTRTKDNVYTFTMPDYAVTVRTTFIPHPSITGVTAQQRYPWNGMVDIAYAVSVDASDDYALRVRAVDRTTGVTNEATTVALEARPLAKGAHTLTWDMDADGFAFVSDDVVFIVSAEPRDAVQLWAGGPYFATRNVGANKPQDYGYHFWWGDTVGYTNKTSKGEWYSVKDGTAFSFDAEHCTTYDKDNSQLQAAGYIDATGNLTAEHDAATAHLGVLWRMLTEDEVNQLVDTKNCLRTWTENWQGTGTNGYVVTGAQKGYQSKSIFLPAGGFGSESGWSGPNAVGDFCSSKPDSNVQRAVVLNFSSSNFRRSLYSRAYGYSIRPVWSGTPAVGVSSPVGLDLRPDVVREVMAPETLTYTTNYPGGAVADATVAITVNGETLASGLMGAGTVEWTPTQAGTNELRHIVTAGGTTIADLTARFYVPGVKVGASAFAVTRTGVCELFGVGATYDGTGVLPSKASVTNVVIANGITRVGEDFFADCPGLTTVTGGRDLVSVGTNAFCNCPALTAITLDCTEIPEGLGDSVTYRTMLASDGTIWQVPTISITGYVETLYGKEKLDDAEWTNLGPAAGAIIYEQGGYHFFRVRLEKAK